MTIRYVLGSRASIGGPLGSGRGGAAAWYLAGGVSAANCVAAYQPKGAASLAASYTNLANPGTYNLEKYGTDITWDNTNGWGTNWASNRFLKTNIIPGEGGWSLIARWSNGTTAYSVAVGNNVNSGYKLGLGSGPFNAGWFHNGGSLLATGGAVAAGVYAVTDEPYRNGADVGTLSGAPGTPATPIVIGGAYNISTAVANVWAGYIQAVAIYNVTLSAAQVAAISTAMAAL